jgi:hypothetical protein
VSFAVITLCVPSQRVFVIVVVVVVVVVVYFIIDSIRKLLDTPSCKLRQLSESMVDCTKFKCLHLFA